MRAINAMKHKKLTARAPSNAVVNYTSTKL